MPTEEFHLNSKKTYSIKVFWVGSWKYTLVSYNDKEIGSFASLKELKKGKEFELDNKQKIFIRLKGIIQPKLELLYNEKVIQSESKSAKQLFKQSYQLAFVIGWANVGMGLISMFYKKNEIGINQFSYLILEYLLYCWQRVLRKDPE